MLIRTARDVVKWVLVLGILGYFASALLFGEDWLDVINVGKWLTFAGVVVGAEAARQRRQSGGGSG